MQNRVSKIASIQAVNCWTLAEAGQERCKKSHKALIKRRRRALEKRQSGQEIRDAAHFTFSV
ncbi:hypothetical protein [Paenibacillus sp. IHBB 3054]|uniref:hypothetical protein n=1 Tax=Paenibacillus sp. IHBB 3054 TaxID=3425689 RepID=UPI003F67E84F